MFLTKMKWPVGMLLVGTVLGAGAGLWSYHPALADAVERKKEDPPRPAAKEADEAQAVARAQPTARPLGTWERDVGPNHITLRIERPTATEEAISEEAKKGYGLLFIGREPASEGKQFDPQITRSAVSFGGPIAITIARGEHQSGNGREDENEPLRILVPVTGTPISRQGAELISFR